MRCKSGVTPGLLEQCEQSRVRHRAESNGDVVGFGKVPESILDEITVTWPISVRKGMMLECLGQVMHPGAEQAPVTALTPFRCHSTVWDVGLSLGGTVGTGSTGPTLSPAPINTHELLPSSGRLSLPAGTLSPCSAPIPALPQGQQC